jgi:Cytochrome c7 and related cytochrome c
LRLRPPVGRAFAHLWPLVGVAVLAVLGTRQSVWRGAASSLVPRGAPVTQPIAFNHLKHTKDLGLECQFCHVYVTTGAHAGLPGADICGMCHQAQLGTSPEAARVTALLTSGDGLRFNKLFRLPAHVYYSHRRHVGIGKLECPQCHGGIAATERPPTRPLVRITMKRCVDCHRAQGQSLDCVACHR